VTPFVSEIHDRKGLQWVDQSRLARGSSLPQAVIGCRRRPNFVRRHLSMTCCHCTAPSGLQMHGAPATAQPSRSRAVGMFFADPARNVANRAALVDDGGRRAGAASLLALARVALGIALERVRLRRARHQRNARVRWPQSCASQPALARTVLDYVGGSDTSHDVPAGLSKAQGASRRRQVPSGCRQTSR